MKKLSEVYKELGIAFTFPIEIKDDNGKQTYRENNDGFWYRREYDKNGKQTYYEDCDGSWWRLEYDKNGNETYDKNANETYFENSSGYWYRYEYDEDGNETYFEDSRGYREGTKRSYCDGKVIEVDGKKYKLMEL